MGHTPGPWDNDGNDISAKGSVIATVTLPPLTDSDRITGPEIVANARLIAAAPELLAALKRRAERRDAFDDDEWQDVMRLIAKTEGRSE